MAKTAVSVASQVIPISNNRLVLPNTAVAEISTITAYEVMKNSPDWLVGRLEWRGKKVPLVSIERIYGEQVEIPQGNIRIAVLNTLNGNEDMSFIAIIIQAIPQLVSLDNSRISNAPGNSKKQDAVLNHVLVNGEPGIIPDIDRLESMLLKEMKSPGKGKGKGKSKVKKKT